MKPGKILAIVGLIVVIAAAAYFAIFGGGGGGGADVPPDRIRHYQCVNKACGKTFSDEDLNLDDAGLYPPSGVMAIKCPACGQFTVFALTKCPYCGAEYVPSEALEGPTGDSKCPKCGKEPK